MLDASSAVKCTLQHKLNGNWRQHLLLLFICASKHLAPHLHAKMRSGSLSGSTHSVLQMSRLLSEQRRGITAQIKM